MWRILEFLRRFGNLLLFLGLEFIALMLIISMNDRQREISQGVFMEMSGGVQQISSNVRGYFNLRKENDALLAQNARQDSLIYRLHAELNVYKNPGPANGYCVLPDSLLPAGAFYFLPCKAINNSVEKNYNYITLDKGSENGVLKGMGIISPQGIVGVVTHVSPHYSLGLSVLNKKFRVSARLKDHENVGNLTWDGYSPSQAILMYIPQTSDIAIGDTVITSGYSTIFPENFYIGTVSGFDSNEHDGFFAIRVDLAVDFRSLYNLYLVGHRDQPELDSLEANGSDE